MKKSHFSPSVLGWFCLAVGLSAALPAASNGTEKDIQIGARAAAFIDPAPRGNVPTAVIYDPADPESTADAEQIMAALGDGLSIKDGRLTGRLVGVDDLDALEPAKVAFLSRGLANHHAAIAKAATNYGILTISADLSCVERNHCVVGVRSTPSVTIIVSQAAQDAATLSFSSAFLMMVEKR